MRAGRSLRHARRRARLTQRALAQETGIAQPTIAKIEAGTAVPRVDTLERLLRACGETVDAVRRSDPGVDRAAIRALVSMPPAERAATLVEDAPTSHRAAGTRP